MNNKRLAIFLGAAALHSVNSFAQTTRNAQVVAGGYVAVVSEVKDGICESCPTYHTEKHAALHKDSRLKADDEVRCFSPAYAKANYVTKDGTPIEGGAFIVKGEAWRPVGNAGSPEDNDLTEPRMGVQASNHADGGVTMSTDPAKVADVEQEAQDLQASQQVTSSQQHSTQMKFHDHAEVLNLANLALASRVRKSLAKAKGISVQNISVRAQGGQVILGGTVPEQPQLEKATEVAKGVAGVTSVRNTLVVHPLGN
ncbi:BON domain-containing protein [Paraburkholderia sp. GAS82]|uniref:BON domain-containing protein n=1 Tax=Paraburkholderia sp. GAS82 TaxID=3035137 RepID=UPI003D1CCB40